MGFGSISIRTHRHTAQLSAGWATFVLQPSGSMSVLISIASKIRFPVWKSICTSRRGCQYPTHSSGRGIPKITTCPQCWHLIDMSHRWVMRCVSCPPAVLSQNSQRRACQSFRPQTQTGVNFGMGSGLSRSQFSSTIRMILLVSPSGYKSRHSMRGHCT